MKIQQFQDEFKPTKNKLQSDGDGYFAIHFSAIDDKWQGGSLGLDALDLGIVVKAFYERVLLELTDKTKPGQFSFGVLNDIVEQCKSLMEDCAPGGESKPIFFRRIGNGQV
jgi:hypothetical protein